MLFNALSCVPVLWGPLSAGRRLAFVHKSPWIPAPTWLFFKIKKKNYLFICLHQVLVAEFGIFSCGTGSADAGGSPSAANCLVA